MARKGRTRRYREARELKQSFDDGLFAESNRSLAEVDLDDKVERRHLGRRVGRGPAP